MKRWVFGHFVASYLCVIVFLTSSIYDTGWSNFNVLGDDAVTVEGLLWTAPITFVFAMRDSIFEGPAPSLLCIPTYPISLFAFLCLTKRRKKEIQGKCDCCGYDLRATPDRCPECGTAPTKTAVPSH
jgi:hypothetical protein